MTTTGVRFTDANIKLEPSYLAMSQHSAEHNLPSHIFPKPHFNPSELVRALAVPGEPVIIFGDGRDPHRFHAAFLCVGRFYVSDIDVLRYSPPPAGLYFKQEKHTHLSYHRHRLPSGRRDLYYPIDPRMRREDIEGETTPYLNEDESAWMFRRGSVGQHHDAELIVMGAVVGLLQPVVDATLSKFLTATSDSAKAEKQVLYVGAVDYRNDVLDRAVAMVRAEPMGVFVKEGHNDSGGVIRRIVAAAAQQVLEEIKKAPVRRHLTSLTTSLLIDPPTPKTRWEIPALAAPVFPTKTGTAQSWTAGTAITPVKPPAAVGHPAPEYSAPFLPTGMAINAADGEITGTPGTSGAGTITVKAKNSQGEDTWTVAYTIAAAD